MIDERPVSRPAHLRRHLEDAQAVPDDHHRRLDLGVVVRVVGREEPDRPRVDAWKPDVVSVSFWRVSSETSCANQRIPARRANGGL